MDLKSPEPFWLVKNGLLNSFPSLREDTICDILVVGGGITGALMAHQCVSEGYDTILIDKREVGHGSSSATTSMLQYEIDVPLYKLCDIIGVEQAIASYNACSQAIDQLEALGTEIGSNAGFARKKSLYFAAKKKDVAGLKNEFEARQAAGFDVIWMESDQIFRNFGLQHTHGGILSSQGASVDAFCLLHELLAYNHERGLRVFDKSELVKVKTHKDVKRCVLSTGVKISARKIVYCVGYESQQMLKERFVNLLSTYAIVSEMDMIGCQKIKDLLIWNTDSPYIYMRCTDDARILVGGGDEKFRNPIRRDALLSRKAERLNKNFEKLFPGQKFYTDFSWTGTFGETKDGLPYIGEHKSFEDSYFVLGFGGNGITFSVVGMEMLSFWLKGQVHPLQEIFAFGR